MKLNLKPSLRLLPELFDIAIEIEEAAKVANETVHGAANPVQVVHKKITLRLPPVLLNRTTTDVGKPITSHLTADTRPPSATIARLQDI